MSHKDLLKQVPMLKVEIDGIKEQLEWLMRMHLPQGIRYDIVKVKGSSGNRDKEYLDDFFILEDKLKEAAQELLQKQSMVFKIISEIEDQRYRILLTERYINGKSWKEIERILPFSERQMYRIHGQALKEFEKLAVNCS